MSKYIITDECRHYLDAILPTFKYDRLAAIRASVEKVIVAEEGNDSKDNVWRIGSAIQSFLEHNNFGHSVDYVFIIDKKGEDLKNSGSLKAYEEREINSN
ncbi:MAG TPA: hypothetical protein VGI43_02170 [Mucilaginibacter sp.]|jgi:uncharacterized protein YnzC (UPF0291/DUF896 family)